jgi:hypothetical protein
VWWDKHDSFTRVSGAMEGSHCAHLRPRLVQGDRGHSSQQGHRGHTGRGHTVRTALVVLVLGCIALAPCRALSSAAETELDVPLERDLEKEAQPALLLESVVVQLFQALTNDSSQTNATVHDAPQPHPDTHRANPSFESFNGTTSSNLTNASTRHLVRVRARHRAPPHPPWLPHSHPHTSRPPHVRLAHTWLGSMAPLWQSLRHLAGVDDGVTAMQRSAYEVPEAVNSVAKANAAVNLRNLDPYDVFWSAVVSLPATLNFVITFVDRLITDAMIDLYDV